MVMLASFQAVDDAALAAIASLDEDELVERLEELYGDDGRPRHDMDKNWDLLHFVLTGVSASRPSENDPLSESVVGVHAYDVEPFISVTKATDVPRILGALRAVDIDGLRGRCGLAAFRKHHLYPTLAETTKAEEDQLWQSIKAEFEGLLGLFETAAAGDLNGIVSIY